MVFIMSIFSENRSRNWFLTQKTNLAINLSATTIVVGFYARQMQKKRCMFLFLKKKIKERTPYKRNTNKYGQDAWAIFIF